MSKIEKLRKKAEDAWTDCDSCNSNDKSMWINGYIVGALANQIELPTDEEIIKQSKYIANNYFEIDIYHANHYQGLEEGSLRMASWMRNKIKGGQDNE